jgi:hypothetical protein
MKLDVAMPADKESGYASLLDGEGTTSSFGRIPQHLLLLGVRSNATLGFVKVSIFHIGPKHAVIRGIKPSSALWGKCIIHMFPLMPPLVSRLVVCRFVWANPGAAHTALTVLARFAPRNLDAKIAVKHELANLVW